MDLSPSIAILLAAYNGERYLSKQLESIFKQDLSLDVYVSLDLSEDGSLDLLESYQSGHQSFFIMPYGFRFGSAGRNFFRLLLDVDFERYDYVAFSDQDDIWFDFKIKRAVEQILENKADGYSSNVTAFWPDGREKLVKKDYPQTEFDFIFESAGPGCTFVITKRLALCIKESLVNNLNNIDNIWLHDWYCYAFARSHDFKWFIDSEPTMAYRQHGGNEVGANAGWKSFKLRALSILSGDGIKKALKQAKFLGLNNTMPLKLLLSGSRWDLLKLAFLSNHCRRKPLDKFLFFFIFCWFAIRGLPVDEYQ